MAAIGLALRWLFSPDRRGATLITLGVLAVFALLGYARYEAHSASVAREANKSLAGARQADTAALGTRDTIQDTIRTTEGTQRANTEAALGANRGWADEPVPPAVLDSLRHNGGAPATP